MPDRRIQVGVIGRAHGVRGYVRVTSHTADPADLTAYGPLSNTAGEVLVLRWVSGGVAEVSRVVEGITVKVTDRALAEKLTNTKLFIDRAALPPPDKDEFYLADLIGLSAIDSNGRRIGSVSMVHDYGAGASLEIVRNGTPPTLVPFTAACVPMVDIAAGKLVAVLPDEVIVPPSAEEEAA